MKTIYSHSYLLLILVAFVFQSCQKDNHDPEPDETSKEFTYLRVLVSDVNSNTLSLLKPASGEMEGFSAKFPKSALYTTESGRLAGIVHRENNLTETFDIGLEFHGDHIGTVGTPKFGALLGESALPTHFKSKYGQILTFNDGDGTLSVAQESDVHTSGAKFSTIQAGLLVHHGAMALFSNGNYAVTVKDNSISGVLPERVKIINSAGQTIHESTLAVQGIHGNASDGTYAVFGSASGVFVVEQDGTQRLIEYPSSFETAWFGTILETSIAGKFIGYTAAKGAYLIDVTANTLTPIIENTDIMQCKTSYDLSKLGVLLHSGVFKWYDLATLSLQNEGSILAATAKDASQKPQLVLSQRFAYITLPTSGELLQVRLQDLASQSKHSMGGTPYQITLLGYESSVGH
ncbi:hypothetical protein CLV98_10750 [Dyadobacter jejuensis]|uniref:Uncharacterized protein n=1 Tax=Dyadobacter jejuensis TaxID=1082580 RepID=A0A316AI29_9BACT|nr:hypothetical protein [Dyadobacter jejuensis]PWJ57343.1 hypothetical protein CLV98_10750 [Dyadobacter jejuensis]